jgi:hypothetical protein
MNRHLHRLGLFTFDQMAGVVDQEFTINREQVVCLRVIQYQASFVHLR